MQVDCYNVVRDVTGQLQYGRFNCPLLMKTERKEMIPSKMVKDKLCISHQCVQGHCKYEEGNKTFTKEREEVVKQCQVYVHDSTNNIFLLNRFYLGESWKYVL